MENHVRIFREHPIAWWDKPVMRYLRKKYGRDKRLFVSLRGVYLALCEIESDFVDTPINFFTETVGTYAGVTREVAGRCIKILEKELLICKSQVKDLTTHKFGRGTIIVLKALRSRPTTSEPLPRIASIGDRRHRGSWAGIRKISNDKKVGTIKNVTEKTAKDKDQVEYYAQLLAEKLSDQKSISFYRLACQRFDPQRLLRKAQEIIADGKARKPAAVFVQWLKDKQQKQEQAAPVPIKTPA